MIEGKNKGSKIIIAIAYLYILLPFIIFSIGWMGKRFWIPTLLILVYCYKKVLKDTLPVWIPELKQENIMKIVFIIVVAFAWVYFSGIGKMVFQNNDHVARNAVFEILVKYDWPVINYNVSIEQFNAGTTATALIYYIGFWLPSALVGKVFGMQAGYTFQVLWAILGILLVYYLMCARKRKLMVWPIVLLIFFSGMDIIGIYMKGMNLSTIANDLHLEWWVEPYQYSSMTTQLFWVFNQAVPAWLCTMLLLVRTNNKSIIFVLACCMLSSTFPFIGLLALVFFFVFLETQTDVKYKDVKSKVVNYLKDIRKHCFSIQNILGGGIIGIFSFLYLKANVAGGEIMEKSIYEYTYDNHLMKYLVFILLEVLVYFLLLFKYNSRNKLYWFVLFCLCVIPPIKVGGAGDFCMRASIPALFILMIMVVDGLESSFKKKDYVWLVGMTVVLCIGAVTPMHEFVRTYKNTTEAVNVGKSAYVEVEDQEEYEIKILNSSNFSGGTDESFFFKYIAK